MASCCKTALQNTISVTYAITFLPGGSFFVAFDLESVWILPFIVFMSYFSVYLSPFLAFLHSLVLQG